MNETERGMFFFIKRKPVIEPRLINKCNPWVIALVNDCMFLGWLCYFCLDFAEVSKDIFVPSKPQRLSKF